MAVVTNQKNNVRRSHEFDSSNFTIEASSEAFRILSDGLYSDKVKAIIRELSTNAVDSLVDANTSDLGFDVHLPTQVAPDFYVRDYGTGLSHAEAMELYTTYFHSNKTHSNNFVGQLGLGSKSPFAYTDNFSITSYQDGKKRLYSAIINEDGFPSINFLGEDDTNQKNGLKVHFPVKSGDITKFHDKAEEVYRWFSLKPNVHPSSFSIDEIEYKMEGNGWKLRDDRYVEAVAVMGNIAYPIDNVDLDGEFRSLLNSPIVVYFDIGDLSVTPSRESLSLNKRTITNLKIRLQEVSDDISDKVSKEFDDCESLWDARCLAQELFGSYSSPLYHLNDICSWSDITWEGQSIKDNRINVRDIEDTYLSKFTNKSLRGYGTNIAVRRESVQSFGVDRDVSIFIDDFDGKNGAASRCRHFVTQHDKSCHLIKFKTANAKTEFLKESGMLSDQLQNASELPKPPRFSSGGRSSSGVRKDTIFKYKYDKYNHTNSSYWISTEVDFDDGGIYVELNRYKVRKNNQTYFHDPEFLNRDISSVNELLGEDVDSPTVFGVKSAIIQRYVDSDLWISLDDFIKDVVKSKSSKLKKLGIAKANVHSIDTFNETSSGVYGWIEMSKYDLGDDINEFSSIIQKMKKCSKYLEENRDLRQLAREYDIKISGTPVFTSEELATLEKDLLESHPMLSVVVGASQVGGYYGRDCFEELLKKNAEVIKNYSEQMKSADTIN